MATDWTMILKHRPGELARLGEITGKLVSLIGDRRRHMLRWVISSIWVCPGVWPGSGVAALF